MSDSNMSPAPGTPQTYTKAWVGGLASAVIAALTALIVAFGDKSEKAGDLSNGEITTVVLAFVIGLGITGGLTAAVKNRPL